MTYFLNHFTVFILPVLILIYAIVGAGIDMIDHYKDK